MLPIIQKLANPNVAFFPSNRIGQHYIPPALSIRQPWAWLIIQGYKDIENRTWKTPFRGPFLIHTGKLLDEGADYAVGIAEQRGIIIPPLESLPRGAIVGAAEVKDCVTTSESPWFFGPYGFVLCNPVTFPTPIPYKGQQGFFRVK